MEQKRRSLARGFPKDSLSVIRLLAGPIGAGLLGSRSTSRERPIRAALVGVLLVLAAIVVGAIPAAAQNRVGASTPAVIDTVGSPAGIGAGQRLGNTGPQPQIVVATAVAADEGATVADRAAAACGGESFTADTNVVMTDGTTKPLAQVKVGDKVEATDPTTGDTSARTVTKVWVNHDTDLMNVTVKAGRKTSTIHATQHHLFWDATRRAWTEADHLAAGDRLLTDSGTLATVASTAIVAGAADMWDLTVDNDHDFYIVAATASVLVHNCAMQSRPSAIARALGYSTKQIRSAIEDVKQQPGWRGGASRNPNVFVDDTTGEVYPRLPNGTAAQDSIGNLYDYLPEEP